MELNRTVKKEGIIILLALVVLYFIEFSKIEFLLYQHLQTVIKISAVSISALIAFYFTRNLLKRLFCQICNILSAFFAQTRRFSRSTFIYTKYLVTSFFAASKESSLIYLRCIKNFVEIIASIITLSAARITANIKRDIIKTFALITKASALITIKASALITKASALITIKASALITKASALITKASALITKASALITKASALITIKASALITKASALITKASALITKASALITIKASALITKASALVQRIIAKRLSIARTKSELFLKESYTRLTTDLREIFDPMNFIPDNEGITKSIKEIPQKIKSKNFVYKLTCVIIFNTFLAVSLIRGFKDESNSIKFPDILEIKFLAYKAFITLLQILKNVFITLLQILKNVFITLLQILKNVFITLLQILKNVFITLLQILKNVFITLLQILKIAFLHITLQARSLHITLQDLFLHITLQDLLIVSITSLLVFLLSIKKVRATADNIFTGLTKIVADSFANAEAKTQEAIKEGAIVTLFVTGQAIIKIWLTIREALAKIESKTRIFLIKAGIIGLLIRGALIRAELTIREITAKTETALQHSIRTETYKIKQEIKQDARDIQQDARDILDKEARQQIKKELYAIKNELKTELSKKEAKKKLAIITASILLLTVLISGSINQENPIWTSFVAASTGGLCDGAYDSTAGTWRRCANSETCCNLAGTACSPVQISSYYCYNSGGGATYDYDKNQASCMADWWCTAGAGQTACTNLGTTDPGSWYWAFSTTMGYESGATDSCCGDDGTGLENVRNCTAGTVSGIGSAGTFDPSGGCDLNKDISCCNSATDCADPERSTAPQAQFCYTASGIGHNVSGAVSTDDFAYCNSGTWYDCDASSSYCVGAAATGCDDATNWPTTGGESSWVNSGEAGIGDYNGTGEIQCCGDDTGENYRTSAGDSADGTDACCSASTDCVMTDLCRASSGGCWSPGTSYYCSSGSWDEADHASGSCTGCNAAWTWYSGYTGGTSTQYCCGDDGNNDDFYYINTGGSPDTCQRCSDGTNNAAVNCYQNWACDVEGKLFTLNTEAACTDSTSCYCYYGESCAADAYTPPFSTALPENCTSGGFNDGVNANCFIEEVGNDTCYSIASDPCTSSGLAAYSNTTCSGEEGEISADGYYCYYDEGCTSSGINSTCTTGSLRPTCNAGSMAGGDCAEYNTGADGITDTCHSSADSCPEWDGGPEGGWSFDNDTTVVPGVTCTTCDSGYQADFTTNKCYFGPITCLTSGWGEVSEENCFEWCWANDLTISPCFGAQTALNRTEPANATTCYYSRTCADPSGGCGWSSASMRQDYCDQCEPAQVTSGSTYCPPINASCSTNCADSGTIWYGSDTTNRCTDTACQLSTSTLNRGYIWGGNASGAFCDNTECRSDCLGSGKCVGDSCQCIATNCASGGCLFVYNSTGSNVTIFSNTGNVITVGDLLTTIGTPDGNDLVITDSTNTTKFWIDDITGNIRIAGTLYENMSTYCNPVGSSFVINNTLGRCVAYINSSGDFWIRGNISTYASQTG